MEEVTLYVGISWDEGRIEEIEERWLPWTVEAPMCDPPYLTKCDMQKEALALGLPLSEAYTDGFPHDNCGGVVSKRGRRSSPRSTGSGQQCTPIGSAKKKESANISAKMCPFSKTGAAAPQSQ